MLKRVLVPLDGSLLARSALDVAVRAADVTTEIVLVTVVQEPKVLNYAAAPVILNPEHFPTLAVMVTNGERYLAEIADSLRKQGYCVSTRVEVGDAAECIIDAATKLGVDLIIMSTHGRSGVTRWLYGSVTRHVLSRTTLPVLVVPNPGISQRTIKIADMIFA